MMKQHKLKILISSLLILLPVLAGVILWNDLPERIATHWGADGQPDGWSNKAFAVFALPCILLVLHLICLFGTSFDKKNKNQNGKVFGLIFWIVPFVSVYACGMMYAIAMGVSLGIPALTCGFVGLAFIVVGNLLPKCKQNSTIGIKLPWTLRDAENWSATHRLGGKLWVVAGFLMLGVAFLPAEFTVYAVLGVVILATAVPTVYSYLYHWKGK